MREWESNSKGRKMKAISHCSMLREWQIVPVNMDGTPMDGVNFPEGCKACRSFGDCVVKVRLAYMVDQLEDAIKVLPG